MQIAHTPIKSYVIVGGGTAGWMTAALLGRVLGKTGASITLVESPEIDTVGVGEATVPSFVDFLKVLGISEQDFVRKTNATFKLGIRFTDWKTLNHSYWHPFGNTGARIDGQPFFQHWLKSHFCGNTKEFTDYAPSAAMAKAHKFYIPDPGTPNNLTRMGYALHFDASLVAKYLAGYSQEHGVKRVLGHVEHVRMHDDGSIKSLDIKHGDSIEADFFFDCSGQRALLMQNALQVGYLDWRQFLPVNGAAVVQSGNTDDFPPYTESIAHEHGWRWRIPLQSRTGNGYVFCDEYCSQEQAAELLLQNIQGEPLGNPRFLRFRTGKREKMWRKNCVAIGLSSGFLEPLESTSIYLIMRAALNFVQLLPDRVHCQATEDEYNRLMDIEYENIRDFIVMHYCTSQRDDSPFWQSWRHRPIPESLTTKLSLYKSQGQLVRNDLDLFASDSWHAVLTGMGIYPRDYSAAVDASEFNKVTKLLNDVEYSLNHSVSQLLTHREYLRRFVSL
jgi:tryptophan 7-halogenase